MTLKVVVLVTDTNTERKAFTLTDEAISKILNSNESEVSKAIKNAEQRGILRVEVKSGSSRTINSVFATPAPYSHIGYNSRTQNRINNIIRNKKQRR